MRQARDRLGRKTGLGGFYRRWNREQRTGLQLAERMAGGAVQFRDKFLPFRHRVGRRLRPRLEFFGIARVRVLEVEEVRGKVGGILSFERDMWHAAVGTPGRGGIEKSHQGREAGLLVEVRMRDCQRRDFQIGRSMRRMKIRSRRVTGHTAFFVIDRAAALGVGVLRHLQVRILPEGPEIGQYGVNVRIFEAMDHARHVRALAARFGIPHKGGEPVAIDTFREVHQVRPFPRHNHARAAVAIRAAEFGKEDRASFGRWFSRVETLVADDVGGRVNGSRKGDCQTQQV